MDFTVPTTKEEMYETLRDIFSYYRLRKFEYENTVITPLNIERLTYTAPTQNELISKATSLLCGAQKERRLKRKESLTAEKSALQNKITELTTAKDAQILSVRSEYAKSVSAMKKEALSKGIMDSDITLQKLSKTEENKNAKITEITSKFNDAVSEINAKITRIDADITGVDTYYQEVESAEVNAKVIELYEKEEEKVLAITKYNNSADEREQRYENSVVEINANLKLKYLQVHETGYSKEELIDMGYYSDAISCVSGYYDSLSPMVAYNDIKSEKKIAVYLDEYYADLVYAYKINAAENPE